MAANGGWPCPISALRLVADATSECHKMVGGAGGYLMELDSMLEAEPSVCWGVPFWGRGVPFHMVDFLENLKRFTFWLSNLSWLVTLGGPELLLIRDRY